MRASQIQLVDVLSSLIVYLVEIDYLPVPSRQFVIESLGDHDEEEPLSSIPCPCLVFSVEAVDVGNPISKFFKKNYRGWRCGVPLFDSLARSRRTMK